MVQRRASRTKLENFQEAAQAEDQPSAYLKRSEDRQHCELVSTKSVVKPEQQALGRMDDSVGKRRLRTRGQSYCTTLASELTCCFNIRPPWTMIVWHCRDSASESGIAGFRIDIEMEVRSLPCSDWLQRRSQTPCTYRNAVRGVQHTNRSTNIEQPRISFCTGWPKETRGSSVVESWNTCFRQQSSSPQAFAQRAMRETL